MFKSNLNKKKSITYQIISALLCLCYLSSAYGLQSIVGKVVVVEPTYMPTKIQFTMDTGNENCPANRWLVWKKTDENNKAVLSVLTTALVTGRTIRFFMTDTEQNCVGSFIHIVK